jgi:chromate transporter
VIIPLMQADAVDHYHWMTGAQFLNAVALGQITPGPVVQTVAVVGAAIVLGLSLGHLWQLGVLALAAVWLLVLRRGVVGTLIGAGVLGVAASLVGLPIG